MNDYSTFDSPVVFALDESDGKRTVRGRPIVFHRPGDPSTEYKFSDHAVYRVDREAIRQAIDKNKDIRALYGHDKNRLLGRTSSGTLRLTISDLGVEAELDLPRTSEGDDALELIRRGDLRGMSFGTTIHRKRWTKEGDLDVGTFTDLDVHEVSIVGSPAFAGTSLGFDSSVSPAELKAEVEAARRTRQIRARLLGLKP